MPEEDTEAVRAAEAAQAEPAEVTCLVALRDARASFQNEIVAHARKHFYGDRWKSEVILPAGARDAGPDRDRLTTEDIDSLRSNETHQIAEFYYLIWKFGLAERRKIRMYLQRHNDDMRAYIKDKEKRDLIGFPLARAKDAIFSETQIERVVQNVSENGLRLDQADLGRLLSTLMSPETTRKTLLSLAKGGLLNRINIGHVLVVSNGTLEGYYESHLRIIVDALKTT